MNVLMKTEAIWFGVLYGFGRAVSGGTPVEDYLGSSMYM